MALVLVPAGLVVAALLAIWVRRRLLGAAGRGGDRLMRGRAARHVVLVARTLVVRADPRTVADLVAPVLADHSRWVLFERAGARDGEVAARTSTSGLTPALPRLAVRASGAPGWSEFGVVEYGWWQRFPQGGRFVKRVVPPARAALEGAGLTVVERVRTFVPPFPGATHDGVRTAVPFDAAGPSDGRFSVD